MTLRSVPYVLALPPPLKNSRHPHAAAFRAFHKAHPEIYVAFAAQAKAAYYSGEKANALALLQSLRAAGAKISNNHAPFYARLFQHVEKKPVFHLRTLRP